jgi:phosphate transport system substrate-binding protein
VQRRSFLLAAGAAAALPLIGGRPATAQTGSVAGAGSALPRAVYQKWIELAGAGPGLKVSYEQNGGAAALEQLKNRAIDFASVDYPRRPAFLRENQLIQFPTVLTPVVPFVNLAGVGDGQLRLTGELLADIFLGKITKWNDAKIKAQNSALNLPATNIVPVHRVEPSGANMLFTTYLTRVSEAWAAGPRAGSTVQWPQGKGAEVDGLDALAAKVKGTPGAIGYGGVTTVKSNGFTSVTLQNRAGEFVKADHASFAKAAEAEDWNTPGFNVDLVDEAASGAWPILAAAFVLVPENPPAEKVEAARNTFKFFDWAFDHGFAAAHELGYEGIPKTAIPAVETVWRRAKDPSGRPIWEA